MTTSASLRIFGLLALIFVVSSSFAQPSTVKNLQPTLSNSTNIKIYKNVVEEFEKKFGTAENVRWEKHQKNFLAKFSVEGQDKRVLFNPRGIVIYEISYGKESHLPTKIRKHVKRNYVEFLITSATLVNEASRSIWVINLEDDQHYVIVRVENDEIEEVKKYFKSKS
jgi:hypothetical protein